MPPDHRENSLDLVKGGLQPPGPRRTPQQCARQLHARGGLEGGSPLHRRECAGGARNREDRDSEGLQPHHKTSQSPRGSANLPCRPTIGKTRLILSKGACSPPAPAARHGSALGHCRPGGWKGEAPFTGASAPAGREIARPAISEGLQPHHKQIESPRGSANSQFALPPDHRENSRDLVKGGPAAPRPPPHAPAVRSAIAGSGGGRGRPPSPARVRRPGEKSRGPRFRRGFSPTTNKSSLREGRPIPNREDRDFGGASAPPQTKPVSARVSQFPIAYQVSPRGS